MLLRVIRLRDVYGCTFAREVETTEVGSWILVGRSEDWIGVWNASYKPPLEDVARLVENGTIQLARFCTVADGKQTRHAITLPSGESWWLSAGMGNQEPFDFPVQESAFLNDGRTHLQLLERELADPGSDARFALNWLRWSKRKQQEYVFGKRETQELENLMRCALLVESRLWERAERWIWDLYQGGVHLSLLYAPTAQLHDVERELLNFPQLAQLFVRKWSQKTQKEELAKHRCVRRCYEGGLLWPVIDVQSPPTYHERLEAHIQLREWLQKNAPDRMDLLPS